MENSEIEYLKETGSKEIPLDKTAEENNIFPIIQSKPDNFIKMEFPENEILVERTEGFYKTPDTVKIGNFFVRKYFDKSKDQYFIYFMKPAMLNSKFNVENSHLSIGEGLLQEFITKLKKLIREIELTPTNEIPNRLKCEDGNLTDHSVESYWKNPISETVGPEKTIYMRY